MPEWGFCHSLMTRGSELIFKSQVRFFLGMYLWRGLVTCIEQASFNVKGSVLSLYNSYNWSHIALRACVNQDKGVSEL